MRMYFMVGVLLITMACSVEYQPNHIESEFYSPFHERIWVMEQEGNSCVVHSGRNGIKVVLDGNTERVGSTRRMVPGSKFRVRVNGNRYETPETFFTYHQAQDVIQDMLVADTVYLEWSEIHGSEGVRQRLTNHITHGGFKEIYQLCKGRVS